mmetsp:Transcript_19448/g.54872  ORF Transcript_19448/g.54872 Transcript_19448/m.54872 type:complete len:204 (-) Transcript_19448:35-646(-)
MPGGAAGLWACGHLLLLALLGLWGEAPVLHRRAVELALQLRPGSLRGLRPQRLGRARCGVLLPARRGPEPLPQRRGGRLPLQRARAVAGGDGRGGRPHLLHGLPQRLPQRQAHGLADLPDLPPRPGHAARRLLPRGLPERVQLADQRLLAEGRRAGAGQGLVGLGPPRAKRPWQREPPHSGLGRQRHRDRQHGLHRGEAQARR